ncbi:MULTISPECIES: TetR/AcrR family transcriptional regulator [unclassified Thioalkalivibrio]|uniref:TetR/AcrR family transcriptional regulator n=1 Tax=unclassified Thioalkalivibrio TaxID=2621013 RepID=UPI00036E9B5D|nr:MULTISPECIES: TetR/AcrR family transcriptional regulator [unclassified Thioalkalivibrio]
MLPAMSTEDRRRREREAREALFIERAHERIREDGLLGLQMSKLAADCEYATGTLYQHFESREDLLAAVAARTTRERAGRFRVIPGLTLGTRSRMLAIVLTDIDFAAQNPDYYRLTQYLVTEVVWANVSVARREALLEAGRPISEAVHAVVAEARERGDLPPAREISEEEMGLGPWALNVGMQSLANARGLLDAYDIHRPYDHLIRHFHALMTGWRWEPRLDPDEPAVVRAETDRVRASLRAAGIGEKVADDGLSAAD